MNKKLIRLAERRSLLVRQAAAQRTALTQSLEPWRPRLAVADRGVAAFRYIGRHPALMAGAALLFAALPATCRQMAAARLGDVADRTQAALEAGVRAGCSWLSHGSNGLSGGKGRYGISRKPVSS
jgi:carbohydrate-selective porin OprB